VLARGGTVLAGRYRVGELLGVGAMGSVWIAEHIVLRRNVVVKFHEESFAGASGKSALARFMREARTLASVRHRNVTELFEVGRTPSGEPYLILELLEGETLARRLTRDRTMSAGDALYVATELCRGLEAVHAAGVLHRDIKPENIFLHQHDGELVPKLLDFGLARPIVAGERLTWTGSAVGTPGYMAPEQARGRTDLDAKADLFSLGVTLYEMLSGELPFVGETMSELLRAAASDDPIPLVVSRPDLAGPLADAVQTALARHPSHRFADARAMRLALTAARSSIATAPVAAARSRRGALTPPYR
jgi:serine/threonine-protein kinase